MKKIITLLLTILFISSCVSFDENQDVEFIDEKQETDTLSTLRAEYRKQFSENCNKFTTIEIEKISKEIDLKSYIEKEISIIKAELELISPDVEVESSLIDINKKYTELKNRITDFESQFIKDRIIENSLSTLIEKFNNDPRSKDIILFGNSNALFIDKNALNAPYSVTSIDGFYLVSKWGLMEEVNSIGINISEKEKEIKLFEIRREAKLFNKITMDNFGFKVFNEDTGLAEQSRLIESFYDEYYDGIEYHKGTIYSLGHFKVFQDVGPGKLISPDSGLLSNQCAYVEDSRPRREGRSYFGPSGKVLYIGDYTYTTILGVRKVVPNFWLIREDLKERFKHLVF